MDKTSDFTRASHRPLEYMIGMDLDGTYRTCNSCKKSGPSDCGLEMSPLMIGDHYGLSAVSSREYSWKDA